MKYLPLVFLAGGLALRLSAAGLMAPDDSGIPFEPAIEATAKALATAERVEIYEGLPNPFGQRELFESEKGSKISRQIEGQWFYSFSQRAKWETTMRLRQLVDEGLFRPWGGTKFCGGFHADYAVALTTGKSTLYVLFCFGCHEAKLVREGNFFAADLGKADFRLTTDLNGKFYKELVSLLAAYHKERPSPLIVPSGR